MIECWVIRIWAVDICKCYMDVIDCSIDNYMASFWVCYGVFVD